jgi:hypothetical protein
MYTTENDVLNLICEIENDPRVNLKVPDKLVNPDALVIAAKHALSLRNEDTQWNLRSQGVLSNSGSLFIRVAPKNVGRALRLFDTNIKVFRTRGHQFIDSEVDIQGQKYTISIREKLKRIEGEYRKTPTNILAIKVHCGYPVMEYYDTKTVLIEEKIARIVAKLEFDVKDLFETWARNDLRRAVEVEKPVILTTLFRSKLTTFSGAN